MTRLSEILLAAMTIPIGWIIAKALRAMSWAAVVLLCAVSVLGAERPRSYFQEDVKATLAAPTPIAHLAVQEFATSDDEPADAVIPARPPVTEPPANDPPVEAPKQFRPRPRPDWEDDDEDDPRDDWHRPDHHRVKVRPTLMSFLRSAIRIYEDLPNELSDDREYDMEPIRVTGWSPAYCQHCPAAKRRLGNDPRVIIDWQTSECPYPHAAGRPWRYPMITDKASFLYIDGNDLESVDTLLDAIRRGRSSKGLQLAEVLTTRIPDTEIGEIEESLAEALEQIGSGELTMKNRRDETFTVQGFSVGLPAGLQVSVGSERGGTRFDFVGAKPTIRANGFWTVKRTVNSVLVSKDLDRITLKLNWWRTLSLRVTRK